MFSSFLKKYTSSTTVSHLTSISTGKPKSISQTFANIKSDAASYCADMVRRGATYDTGEDVDATIMKKCLLSRPEIQHKEIHENNLLLQPK